MFPSAVVGIVGKLAFSPRMRGCSFWLITPIWGSKVFPAYAGMFPAPPTNTAESPCFPRVCGDVPTRGFTEAARAAFSPHTRGCSEEDLEQAQCHLVFPAYARMFPTWATTTGTWKGFPRIRGDVPRGNHPSRNGKNFSPHTRGCSGAGVGSRHTGVVFPAYAGIFQRQGLQ